MIAPNEFVQTVEAMSRKELVSKASEEGYDKAANASSADLRHFLVEKFEPTGKVPAKLKGSPETIMLREQYRLAREAIKAAIKANQVARQTWLSTGTEEAKLAYATTRANHKATLVHIKEVRPKYEASRLADQAAEDAGEVEIGTVKA